MEVLLYTIKVKDVKVNTCTRNFMFKINKW